VSWQLALAACGASHITRPEQSRSFGQQSCALWTGGASIYDRILQHKAAVVEPREAALFPESAALYRSKLIDGGAVFFAVCRCACQHVVCCLFLHAAGMPRQPAHGASPCGMTCPSCPNCLCLSACDPPWAVGLQGQGQRGSGLCGRGRPCGGHHRHPLRPTARRQGATGPPPVQQLHEY
jgi:hypothetical protein